MNVMVFSPHPDDEALGCGGAIRKHVLDGDTVTVFYVTSGEKGIPDQSEETTMQMREQEARACAQVLGIDRQIFLRLFDGGLSGDKAMPTILDEIVKSEQPDLIYAPHGDDGHTDHMAVGRIARKIVGGRIPLRLYEIWTPLAHPYVIEDITSVMSEKRGAIRAYASQEQRNGFVEGIMALNHYRGILHGPNMMYAEAFGVA